MLAVSNLTYERYYLPVFKPVSFEMGPGETLVVTGPNGSGKTTLIRLLAGILPAECGSLDRASVKTAYLGHRLAIKDDLSTLENIRFMRRFLAVESGNGDGSESNILSRVGLNHVAMQPARSLSAGQRKRCALARLLVSDADLWLLDEPYSNLDANGVDLVDDLIASHVHNGGGCVMATHGDHRPANIDLAEVGLLPGDPDLYKASIH